MPNAATPSSPFVERFGVGELANRQPLIAVSGKRVKPSWRVTPVLVLMPPVRPMTVEAGWRDLERIWYVDRGAAGAPLIHSTRTSR